MPCFVVAVALALCTLGYDVPARMSNAAIEWVRLGDVQGVGRGRLPGGGEGVSRAIQV